MSSGRSKSQEGSLQKNQRQTCSVTLFASFAGAKSPSKSRALIMC